MPEPPLNRRGALGHRLAGGNDILLNGLAFTNPIRRASKAPNHTSGRIFQRNVRSKGHLRQLTEHAPTESAPRRGYDSRAAAFTPFYLEATPASASPLQTPH